MRKLGSLALLAVLALSLGATLGLFGPAQADDCSACAGQPCTFLCSACTCCSGALAVAFAPELGLAPQPLAVTPVSAALPPSAPPRGILHVPLSA